MVNKKNQGESVAVIKTTRFILPVVLVCIGCAIAWFVIEYPSDRMVSNYVTTDKTIASVLRLIYLSGISIVLAILTAIPIGIALSRKPFRRIAGVVVSIVNICQAVPALAVIAIVFTFLGIGVQTAIVALWVYSMLPIVNNTYAGIESVDTSIIEAAHGLGMSQSEIFWKVEFPLAFPAIVAGVRTALIINIGTAVVAAFVGAGGLGDFIIAGKAVNRAQILMVGGGLTTIVALLADSSIAMLEDVAAQRFAK